MTTLTRDDLINEALHLVSWQAKRFPRLPHGINRDDLESAGNEALLHAAETYDAANGGWPSWARIHIRGAMKRVIRSARKHRHAALQPVIDEQELPPPVDVRASDPAELAEVRELIRPRRVGVTVKELQATMPSPSAVATRVTELRKAMFEAVSQEDITAVMQTVVRDAKAGDLKAARLLIDLLAPGRSGVTVHQQAVVINSGDLS